MIEDNLWIRYVDHRISSALIFFLLLMMLGNGKKRRSFALRAAGSFVLLCAASWTVRFAIETLIASHVLQGLGFSLHLLLMNVLFLLVYAFCY